MRAQTHGPPPHLGRAPERCFLPKEHVHTWKGHSKGVAAIRFIPTSGHLLLSCGLDAKIKILKVFGKRRCVQTYHGHSKAVRDICFNNDGTKFLSTGYDKQFKLWDTETGKVIGRYGNNKVCARPPFLDSMRPRKARFIRCR